MGCIADFIAWLKGTTAAAAAAAPHPAIIEAADKIVAASKRIEASADRFDTFGKMVKDMSGKRARKPAKKKGKASC